jgi:radical SAM protein with 4Fe4S-binding SPASM domain
MPTSQQEVDISVLRKQGFVENSIKKNNGFPVFSIVELNIYGACNRTCSFCPVSDKNFYTNKYEGISLVLYKKILDDLKTIQYDGVLFFSAFSEPFLSKDLLSLIELTKTILPNVKLEIVSNGDVIKKKPNKMLEVFDMGLDTLNISIYDGEKAFDDFQKLVESLKLTDKQVILKRRYYDESTGNYGIIFSNRTGYVKTSELQGFSPENTEELPLKKNCFYPFYEVLIDYNGDMILCPHDWGKKYIIGNVEETNLWDLWTSKRYEVARIKLSQKDRNFKPCNTCDVQGDVMGRKNFEAWSSK